MSARRILHFFTAAALGVAVVSLAAQAPGAPSLLVSMVATPAGPGSAQPQLSVSANGVLLSWIERAGKVATLKFAERTPTGWTTPRTVARGEDWFVNWADVPSVLRMSDGTLAAHWLQKSDTGTYAYDVRLSYSKDDGRTWAASFLPHSDGTKTEHGFASLVEMPNAGLGLVWLDGRATMGGHESPEGHAGGAMTVRFAAFDKKWKQTADLLIDDRVCDCCPTATAVTSEGLIAAFRNRSETEIRDIHVARLVNGKWTGSTAVHADGWQIDGCPVNGPAIDARGRNVVVSWFTTIDNQTQSLVAFSKDAGRTFSKPTRLDTRGSLGRVDVAMLPDGDALATWIEHFDQKAEFRVRRVTPEGVSSPAATIASISTSRTSGYPRMALFNNALTFAWIESVNGATSVRTATSAIPAR